MRSAVTVKSDDESHHPGKFHLPGAEAALVVLSMLILVLPAFVPDGPEARLLPVSSDVEPLRIDVESAPWYEWALLEGIGEVRARRIVDYVSRHRPLESIEQLRGVPGLPRGWLEKARPFLGFRRKAPAP